MKSELRECLEIGKDNIYLFHTWIKKINSEGEVLVAVVEDALGVMHEIKSQDLRFITKEYLNAKYGDKF